MAYQIVDSDLPGRPYAVIDTANQTVMGCHSTRAAASIQMSTLYVNGPNDEAPPPPARAAAPPPAPKPEPKPLGRPTPPRDASVSYSPSRTAMW